jgi:RNA polymerase sigma-70 factor (ECF subfamily)
VDDIDIALMMMDGDSEGARWLLKKHGGKVQAGLQRRFHRVLADLEINEALNVATFNAFRAAHQYDESQGSLRAWFYKIAHNAALDILRGEEQHKAIPLEFAPPQPAEVDAQEDDHDHPEQQKLSLDLREAIASLPKLQKAIIEADLASEEGIADSQRLAQSHGSTVNSIYVSRSQARNKLREDMRRRGYQTPSKSQRRGIK